MLLKIFRFATIVFLVLWMAFIFSLSAETSAESSQTSGGLIERVVSIIFPELDESKQTEIVSSCQHIVRKGAHFTIYGILGFLSFLSFISYTKLLFKVRVAISSVICLLYASSDEIHQLFVPGRSGEVRDVCIDFSGAMLAICLCTLIVFLNKKLKNILFKTGKTV